MMLFLHDGVIKFCCHCAPYLRPMYRAKHLSNNTLFGSIFRKLNNHNLQINWASAAWKQSLITSYKENTGKYSAHYSYKFFSLSLGNK